MLTILRVYGVHTQETRETCASNPGATTLVHTFAFEDGLMDDNDLRSIGLPWRSQMGEFGAGGGQEGAMAAGSSRSAGHVFWCLGAPLLGHGK